MRPVVLCVFVLLLAVVIPAQAAPRNAKDGGIKAAKKVSIATFDSNLPNISLEYFLNYESNGAPIDWTVVSCDERATNPVVDKQERMNSKGNKHDRPLCVQATVDNVRVQRSAMVVVQVGTIRAGAVGTPKLQLVMAQDENGASHVIRLIDLPAAMRRWRPRSHPIRDLPERLGAVG
jgi:hypothetical protein